MVVNVKYRLQFDHEYTLQLLNTQEDLMSITVPANIHAICGHANIHANDINHA